MPELCERARSGFPRVGEPVTIRARIPYYREGMTPTIAVEPVRISHETARLGAHPEERYGQCSCCGASDGVLDVVIGWTTETYARDHGFAVLSGGVRSAMCPACRALLRRALEEAS